MTLDFIEYPDREMLALSVADKMAGQLAQHLRVNERASLCVPGGTSPAPIFDTLSGTDLDWARVTVFLNDERWVDAGHSRSNSRLLRRHLLRDRAETAQYIDLFTGDPDPVTAATLLSPAIEEQLPITVLLLGMGHDMHTASLFPGLSDTIAALSPDAPAVVPIRGGGEEPRISLSARALKNAINIHLLITGPEKRAALERAQTLDPIEAPVRALLGDITVHWAE